MNFIAKKPAARFFTMSQELVDGLLALNTRNRSIRKRTVAHYARILQEQYWVETNQGVGVSTEGVLIDGQHRLLALREAGYPAVTMLVVVGLPPDAGAAVDNGVNRSAADYLHFLFDTQITNYIAAALRAVLCYENNFTDWANKRLPQEYAVAYAEYGPSIALVLTIPGYRQFPSSFGAALIVAHHSGVAAETIREFAAATLTGEMLAKGDPALALRKFFANTRGQNTGHMIVERFQKTTSALMSYIKGKPVVALHGISTNKFPAYRQSAKGVAA